jgi:hypothetical protein
MMPGSAFARVALVACVVLIAATGCTGHDCKAIGLEGPLVRIAVPKEFADGATTFRVCADTSCRDGLLPSRDGGEYAVTFVAKDATWGRSVTLTLAGTANSEVNAATTVRTHAFYPGCIETPVVAARFNSATGRLEPSDYSFNHPLA